mgnify:CR=1 FL=1
MLVLDKNPKIIELWKRIKDIDIKLDKLDTQYWNIQNHRKSQGLSLAIYKCSDPEALQLIQIDNKTKELEKLQDQLLKEKRDESDQQWTKQLCKLIKLYGGKKYKVEINNKIIAITDNFHKAIKNTKPTDKIKVSKLIYCNLEKTLPYEITVYYKRIIGNQVYEDRDYMANNGKLLDHQKYYNGHLWWREIRRNDNFFYAFNTIFNIEFFNFHNYGGADEKNFFSTWIWLSPNKDVTTDIWFSNHTKGIPDKYRDKFNKFVNRYKKDRYLKNILSKLDQIQI